MFNTKTIVVLASLLIIFAILIGAVVSGFINMLSGDTREYEEAQQIPHDLMDKDWGIIIADSDEDMLSDIAENFVYGTDPMNPDTDSDWLSDGWEAFYATRNPVTGRLNLDPNRYDNRENPDDDWFDINTNEKRENTNSI